MTGQYDDLLAALLELQTGDARLVLVTDVTLTPSDVIADEDGGTTASFGGETFVYTTSSLQALEDADDAGDQGSSPSPSPTP